VGSKTRSAARGPVTPTKDPEEDCLVDIAIRGRNVEVPESMRAVVAEKVTRAARMFDGMDRAEVFLSEERNPRIADKDVCEVTMTGHGRTVRARATGPDVTTAVDRVVDKLTHRMEKLKGKLTARSHPRRNGSLDSSPVGTRVD
jgi:putative sigma-54 modulation protein